MSPRLSVLGQRRVFVVATLIVGAFVLFFPARQLVLQRERIDSQEERRAALHAENQRLAEEAARLSDPAELEVHARDRLGLVRPGERAYFIESTGVPEAPAEVDAPPSVWGRMWSWVSSLVRGRS